MPTSSTATVQLGTYNPVTDAFTMVLDLNDQSSIWQLNGSPQIEQPELKVQRAESPRLDGERITNMTWGNRKVTLKMNFGRALRYDQIRALITAFVALVSTQNTATNGALVLRYAPPSPAANVNYSYFDVIGVTHDADKIDSMRILNGKARINAILECSPYIRGDRQWLQNLVMNPGFEGPTGGGVTTAMPAGFYDTFANTNAYAIQAGTLTTDKSFYTDTLLAQGTPLRLFRLDESGSPANDGAGSGASLTIQGSGTTFAQTSLLTGDTGDKSVKFNGSGYYAGSDTGLPSGAGAVTLICWFKQTTGGATQMLVSYGTNSLNHAWQMYLDASNKLNFGLAGGTQITDAAATTVGNVYCAVATYDGTNARLYKNGSLVAGPTAMASAAITLGGATGVTMGAFLDATLKFNGTMDEFSVFGVALGATPISSIYTAGTTNPATVSQSMQISSGGRVSFGSPAWCATLWQQRFRYYAGGTCRWYLHYTDANNWLKAELTPSALRLQHNIASVTTTLATTAITPGNEVPYWIRITQFPVASASPPTLQAVLYLDANGALGSQIASLGSSVAQSGTVAIVGAPQIEASGAVMGVGGNFANVHAVNLFGPGGFSTSNFSGVSSYGWDGTRVELGMSGTATAGTQTYPNGPATSFGSLRVDAPPAGTWNAIWTTAFTGGAPAGTAAIPIRTAGDTIKVSVQTKSSGLGSSGQIAVYLLEYNSSGTFLRQTSVQSVTGNQASWTTLSGAIVTGANAAYASVSLNPLDSTTGSPNAIIWFDNLQVWNQTETSMTTMPYCELRSPNSPAQLLLSGLLGEAPAPAIYNIMTYFSSLGSSAILPFYIGMRERAGANAQLVGAGRTNGNILDSSAWGGFFSSATNFVGTINAFAGAKLSDMLGVYRLLLRIKTTQSGGNLPSTTAQAYLPWGSSVLGVAYGKLITPAYSASSAMQITDAGLASFPPVPASAIHDMTSMTIYPSVYMADPNMSGAVTLTWNYQVNLPSDENGTLIVGQMTSPISTSGFPGTMHVVIDGLNAQYQRSDIGVTALLGQSLTVTGFQITPSLAENGPGISGSGGTLGVSLGQDSVPRVDPTVTVGATTGINQGVALITDSAATIYPFAMDVIYSPLYLYPRS